MVSVKQLDLKVMEVLVGKAMLNNGSKDHFYQNSPKYQS